MSIGEIENKPLISVVITNYNYGQYIEEAITSILNQTYKNIELIIINDGSTDNSDDVINKIIAKNLGRNIVYVKRDNKGVVYTRNEGLKLAKGEYLCYLDADDYFNLDYIERNYQIAMEHNADVVYPNWHFVGDWLGWPDTNFPEFKPKLLQLQKIHCTPASLIRKEAVKDTYFETEEVAEDWDFFISMSLKGATFKLAKDNCINYRIRKGTRGSKNDPKVDTYHFMKILKKHKKKHGNKVINPAMLYADRHSKLIKVLRRLRPVAVSLRRIIRHMPIRKILGKIKFIFIEKTWRILRKGRNKKYKKIISSINIKRSPQTKLAVVIHLYYTDLWVAIKEQLSNVNVPFDLFVSVQMKDKDIILEKISKYHNETNIIALPNRGRDILPFLIVAEKIHNENQYEYLLKLHSKKSPHRKDGSEWLRSLLEQLVPQDTSEIIRVLSKPDTGVIGPEDHLVSLSRYMGANRERIMMIIKDLSNKTNANEILDAANEHPFFGGTMFWCRVDFLLPLINSKITPADFNTEKNQVDGTTAHAIERVLGKIMHNILDKKMYALKDSVIYEVNRKSYNSEYKYVE